MPVCDARVDAYIAAAAPFARPILTRLRAAVHEACPDVTETMKWSRPHFDYHGVFCGMSAFKAHCVFGFWKQTLLGPALPAAQAKALAGLERIDDDADLPTDKVLTAIVKTAARLQETGAKVPRVAKAPKPPVQEPSYLIKALKTNAAAWKTWSAFSPSHRREYVDWITEAKAEATRDRRVAQTIEWVATGKGRNWKYERA